MSHATAAPDSLLSRLAAVVARPREAMSAAASLSWGRLVGSWMAILAIWLAAGVVLLSTAVGRQALVDERVRVTEALGGTVDDAAYSALMQAPPFTTYFTSGGRTLLVPAVTVGVAALLHLWLRRTASVPFRGVLAVTVHATAILALQQVLATPLHLVRESLTSPFNASALAPMFDEGSLPARFLGTIEIFGVWWVGLLALGCAALTGRRARTFLGPLVGAYVLVAAAVAVTVVTLGGR